MGLTSYFRRTQKSESIKVKKSHERADRLFYKSIGYTVWEPNKFLLTTNVFFVVVVVF